LVTLISLPLIFFAVAESGDYTGGDIDPVTGKKVRRSLSEKDFEKGGNVIVNRYKKDGRLYYLVNDANNPGKKIRRYVTEGDFKGELKTTGKTQEVSKMSYYRDAYSLTSGGSKANPGYLKEKYYAEYANGMKALGNAARLEWLRTDTYKKDPAAEKKYSAEVASLDKKYKAALKNAPRERQAQLDANRKLFYQKRDNPGMTYEEEKKFRGQAITASRKKYNLTGKQKIDISDREWEAIQARAISPNRLNNIIKHCDMDSLKQRAMPKHSAAISSAKESLMKSLKNSGYSNKEIADRLGISASTVYNTLKE
jgi:DNA-binding CsgD family transcriptional regulator